MKIKSETLRDLMMFFNIIGFIFLVILFTNPENIIVQKIIHGCVLASVSIMFLTYYILGKEIKELEKK